jgi:hypothetical protein
MLVNQGQEYADITKGLEEVINTFSETKFFKVVINIVIGFLLPSY